MRLVERIGWHEPKPTIDQDAGLIKSVKIIGLVSSNGRKYSPKALESALPLYEGVGVNLDHRSEGERSVSDGFGRLVNVAMKEDGVYGDLEYLKTHPRAEQLVETAERMPEQLGMSHQATGQVRQDGDSVIVEEIKSVESVDLVRYPATTRGLFESESTLIESLIKEEDTAVADPEQETEDAPKDEADEADEETEDKDDDVTDEQKEETEEETAKEQKETPDLSAKLTSLEETITDMQHDIMILTQLNAHHIDGAALTEEQMKELRGKRTSEDVASFIKHLPASVHGRERPAMGGKTTVGYKALREQLERQYSFK